MADNEGKRASFPRQPSASSPKLRIYESLFLFNQRADRFVEILSSMERFPFADKESLRSAAVQVEEIRCDLNADFVEHLAGTERLDEGRFWKQRRAFDKKRHDPDDVYIDVERREEERKKQGLPPRLLGSIVPHSAVAGAEDRWEAQHERKKKHPRRVGSLLLKPRAQRWGKAITKKRGAAEPEIWGGATPVTRPKSEGSSTS